MDVDSWIRHWDGHVGGWIGREQVGVNPVTSPRRDAARETAGETSLRLRRELVARPARLIRSPTGKKEYTMRTSSLRSFAATVLLAAVCMLLASTAALGQVVVRSSSVNVFSGGALVPGASATLVRNSSGVTAAFHTSQLDPGAVYTVWLVIFNEPDGCSGPCDLADVVPFPGNPAAVVSLVNIGGHVIGQNGRSNFGGRLNTGDASTALFGPGLLDPFKAEIHIVLRTHGQPIAGMIDDQTASFNGGCPPNTCANHQVSMFPATAVDDSLARLESLQEELDRTKRVVNRIALRLGIFLQPDAAQ
jgi:hypothetical protein